MKDRNVQHASRFRLTKVPGTDDVYDLIPAPGEVYEEGTLINKSSLLKDATAALFGLGADAVPDDVLAFLGKFNQHWWKRVTNGVYVEAKGSTITTIFSDRYNTNKHSIKYSDSVVIDSNTGSVSLGEPIKTISISVYGGGNGIVDSAWDNIKGKYFIPHINGADADYIAFLNSNAEISFEYHGSETYEAMLTVPSGECYKVASKISEGETFYVYSEDRNKYPDDGEQNGYFYTYIGVPFENAVTAPAIATGSYVGTDTYGASNPNILTFDFEPKALFLFNGDLNSKMEAPMLLVSPYTNQEFVQGTAGGYDIIVSWGKTVTWYSPDGNKYVQFNSNYGQNYYFAIG